MPDRTAGVCRDLRTDQLTVKVIDEDRIGADDLIGTCRTTLEARADGRWQDLALPVVGSNDLSRLHLSVAFVPLTGTLRRSMPQIESAGAAAFHAPFGNSRSGSA